MEHHRRNRVDDVTIKTLLRSQNVEKVWKLGWPEGADTIMQCTKPKQLYLMYLKW